MAKRVDGIVEAVRYTPEGWIEFVRMFRRRGPTFSDWVLVSREQLVAELQDKKRYYTGAAVPLMGTTFTTEHPLKVVTREKQPHVLAGEESSETDALKGVPRI